MTIISRGRVAPLLSLACGALLATPAVAQRGIVIDQPPFYDAGVCSLSNPVCAGYSLNFGTDRLAQVFVYSEGIVSFGAPLSAGASFSDGPSTFGDVNWFAPGFGTTQYQPRISYTNFGVGPQPLIGFFAPGVPITAEVFDDLETEEIDESRPASTPLMQIQLYTSSQTDYEDATIGFGYSTGFAPDPGALIGFSAQGGTQFVTNSGGLRVSQSNFAVVLPGMEEFETQFTDPDTGEVFSEFGLRFPAPISQFNIVRDVIAPPVTTAVPEPATWAMMIIGLGLVGGAARSSRRRLATATV